MKVCPKCGALLDDQDRFCTNCGMAQAPIAAQGHGPAQGPYENRQPYKAPGTNDAGKDRKKEGFWSTSGGKLMLGLMLLVVTGGLVLAGFLLFRGSDDSSASTPTKPGKDSAQVETLPQATEDPVSTAHETEENSMAPSREAEEPSAQSREEAPATVPDTTAPAESGQNGPSFNPETTTAAPPPTQPPQTEAPQTEAPADPQTMRGIIGAEPSQDIVDIRERFYAIADHLDNYRSEETIGGTCYFTQDGKELICVQLGPGGSQNAGTGYEEYYFRNGQLIFADYYYNKDTLQGLTRFYYKDGKVIRYSEGGETVDHDYPGGVDPRSLAEYYGEPDLYSAGMRLWEKAMNE